MHELPATQGMLEVALEAARDAGATKAGTDAGVLPVRRTTLREHELDGRTPMKVPVVKEILKADAVPTPTA